MAREAEKLYGAVPEEKFPIPAADISKVDPKYFRRTVRYDTKEASGTLIVDPGNYYVYRIEEGGALSDYYPLTPETRAEYERWRDKVKESQ